MNKTSQAAKDASLSFVRFIAMCFIVLCHILQYYGNALAWWFNVGVQMFLFLSGYLYGAKKQKNLLLFYKRCLIKILTDYYLYLLLYFALFTPLLARICGESPVNMRSVLGLLTLTQTASGIHHLWYIPYILLCYLIVPFAYEGIQMIISRRFFYVYTVVFLLLLELLVAKAVPPLNPAWIVCFLLGMVFRALELHQPALTRRFISICCALCMIMNAIQIGAQYFSIPQVTGPWAVLQARWNDYAHVFLGITLFFAFRRAYHAIHSTRIHRWLSPALCWSDRYSYDVYLVHHVYILSYCSLLYWVKPTILALCATFVLTIITAIALGRLSALVRKALFFS